MTVTEFAQLQTSPSSLKSIVFKLTANCQLTLTIAPYRSGCALGRIGRVTLFPQFPG